MVDLTTPRRRDEVAEHRRVLHLVRPFMDRFPDWNHRAARASATILSHVTLPEEKQEHRRLLDDLNAEVEAAYAQFEAIVAGHPYHSRIADIRAAFERLLVILQQNRGGVT